MQCQFFLRTNDNLFHLFNGFRAFFNHRGLLPPTRAEFVAESDECEACNITAKCFATAP